MPAKLPPLTHPQFAVLSTIFNGEAEGVDIRAELESEYGINRSRAAFYLFMNRIEERGLVSSKFGPSQKTGHPRAGFYTITEKGQKEWQENIDFYARHAAPE